MRFFLITLTLFSIAQLGFSGETADSHPLPTPVICQIGDVRFQLAESLYVQRFRNRQARSARMVAGSSLPNIGGLVYNSNGKIQAMKGFNFGVGLSYRRYLGDGLTPNQFNPYWGIGTFVLVLPYWEVGLTYPIPIKEAIPEARDQLLLNIDLGLIYVVPYIGLSLVF